jgi:predicted transcriptional regulator YdeE
MAELLNFETTVLPETLVIGKQTRIPMESVKGPENPLPGFWDKCHADGTFQALEAMGDFIYNKDYVGVMLDWDRGDGNFTYVVGMLMKVGAAVPEGFVSYTIGPSKVAFSWIRGENTADACAGAHTLTEMFLEECGLSCENMTWSMELYNCPRYTSPNADGEIIIDYYVPLD